MKPLVSIILPVHNEEHNVREIYRQIRDVLDAEGSSFEIIFVDDGSTDGSRREIESLAASEARVKMISFSRNFGHQPALSAGYDLCSGNAAITMDADLQHPVELLPALIAKWREGNEVVIGIRKETEGASLAKRLTSQWFYSVFRLLGDVKLEANAADYRLLDEKVVLNLRNLPERTRFLRGLTSWLGFRVARVEYVANPRKHGQTKYSARKMMRFAIEGITSFSSKPLKVVAAVGLAITLLAMVYAGLALYTSLVLHRTVPGWTSVILVLLGLGGIQITSIGVLEIYLGKIFDEVKGRPIYVIDKKLGW